MSIAWTVKPFRFVGTSLVMETTPAPRFEGAERVGGGPKREWKIPEFSRQVEKFSTFSHAFPVPKK